MILQSSILIQHSNQHGIVRLSTWNSNLQEEGYWPTCWSCLMTAVPIKVSIMIESMPWSSKLNLKSTRSINLNSRLEVYCWPELRRLGFHDSIWQYSFSLKFEAAVWSQSNCFSFSNCGLGKAGRNRRMLVLPAMILGVRILCSRIDWQNLLNFASSACSKRDHYMIS